MEPTATLAVLRTTTILTGDSVAGASTADVEPTAMLAIVKTTDVEPTATLAIVKTTGLWAV